MTTTAKAVRRLADAMDRLEWCVKQRRPTFHVYATESAEACNAWRDADLKVPPEAEASRQALLDLEHAAKLWEVDDAALSNGTAGTTEEEAKAMRAGFDAAIVAAQQVLAALLVRSYFGIERPVGEVEATEPAVVAAAEVTS
jgi:hypothetical protein